MPAASHMCCQQGWHAWGQQAGSRAQAAWAAGRAAGSRRGQVQAACSPAEAACKQTLQVSVRAVKYRLVPLACDKASAAARRCV